MRVAFPPLTTKMVKICRLLNKFDRWQYLANALGVRSNVWKTFDPQTLQSPTKILFEWLDAERPELTVAEICDALRKIERNDVVLLLEKYISS